MTTAITLADIRQIESEIMAHEAAILELRARMREMLDIGVTRRTASSSRQNGLSREQLQRLLRSRTAAPATGVA